MTADGYATDQDRASVEQAAELDRLRADDPEVSRLADALATLAAAAGRLAGWAEHWKRGQ